MQKTRTGFPVVTSILAVLRHGRAGECYNLVDHEPVTEMHFYT
jgi:hypothetical protein